jgi:hypothetical protein
VRFVLRVSDEAPLGVAFVSGQRPVRRGHRRHHQHVVLRPLQRHGEGATYQDTRLDVRAVVAEPAAAAR